MSQTTDLSEEIVSLPTEAETVTDPDRPRVSVSAVGLRRFVNVCSLYILAGAIVGFLVLGVLLPSLPSSRLSVHIDMYTSQGPTISLYLNPLSIPPEVGPVKAGQRSTYTFPTPDAPISRIRLDFPNAVGVTVRVYSISVTGASGRVVAYYGPNNLNTWARYFVTAPVSNSKPLEVTTTATGASIDAFRSVSDKQNLPAPLGTLVHDARNSGTRLELAIWGSAVVVGLTLLLRKRARAGLLAAATLAAVSTVTLYEAVHYRGALTAPTLAVGASAFSGFSLSTNTRAIFAMYGATTVCAVLIVIAGRRFNRLKEERRATLLPRRQSTPRHRRKAEQSRPVDTSAVDHSPIRRGGGWIVVALFCLTLVLAAFLPDLNALIASTRTQQYAPGFDSGNLLAWTAFATRGLVPMRDFWYPYGNDLLFQSNLLTGSMLYFCYQAVGIFGYAWVFWRLSGRRAVVTCLATLGLVLAAPLIGEFPRYGFAFMIALVFCVVRTTETPRARFWSRVTLTLVVAMAAFIEADLLAYAGVGVLVEMLFECAARLWPPYAEAERGPVAGWRSWFGGLLADLIGPVLVIAAALGVSAARGQIGNIVAFYGQSGTLADYSGYGAPLVTGIRSLPSLNVVLVWLPPCVLGIAIVLRWGLRHSSQAMLASMLAVVAGAGAVLLYKDAVRTLTGDLTLMLVLVLVLSVVAVARHVLTERCRVMAVALGLVVGFLTAAVAIAGEVPVLKSGVGTAPARLYRDLVAVVHPSAADRAVEATRFDSSHFSQFPGELALARAIRPLVGGSSFNLFILGDDPVEYVLLAQQPSWETNVYNTSPIRDQYRVIAWLKQHTPAVAVLDLQDGQIFDGVPDDVRIPLVYEHIVSTYEPEKRVGGFDVLRRRRPGEKPATAFWMSQLGQVLNLGAIPDAEPAIPPATTGGMRTPVLRVRTRASGAKEQVSVPISFGGSALTVQFQTVPDRNSYDIPIDRLWPWALSHHVEIGDAPTRGWSATVVSGSLPTGRLY